MNLPLRSVLTMLFSRRFTVGVYEGVLRGEAGNGSLHYVGKGDSLAWLQHLLFETEPKTCQTRQTSLLALRVGGLPPAASGLHVVEVTPFLDRLLRPQGHIVIPDWIEHLLDLDGDWAAVCGRFRKSTLKRDVPRIQRAGFRYDIVQDAASLEIFYENQYAPLMADRHGEAGVLVSRDWLRTTTPTHRLFRLWDDGHWVASALFREVGEELDWILVGMNRQQPSPNQRLVQGALYYHMIQHAHASGFRRIRLGTTRPLLTDGVWLHKRKWGACVVASPQSETRLYLSANRPDGTMVSWLTRQPWVSVSADTLEVQVCALSSALIPDVLDVLKQGVLDGISRIRVFSPFSDSGLPECIDGIPLEQSIFTFGERS